MNLAVSDSDAGEREIVGDDIMSVAEIGLLNSTKGENTQRHG
jgi:hypothetical protein